MNLTQSARRHDQPLRLGAQHGYRFDGDQVFINADLDVPPYFSGGTWSLELWACEEPHSEGPLSGVKVSEIDLRLPTPLAQHVHRVETGVAAHLPPHGTDRVMVLALVEQGADGRRVIQDFSNYGRRQSFAAPHLEGAVGYTIAAGEVQLEVEAVVNSRPIGNYSGSLSLELWAFPAGERASEGQRLAGAELPRVAGQCRLTPAPLRAVFVEPSPGQWQLGLLLREWTEAQGYVTRDQRLFTSLYERAAPAVAAPVVAEPVVAAPVVVEAVVVEPVVAAPVIVEPVVAEPVVAEPVVAEPVVVAPVAPAPVAAAPAPVKVAAKSAATATVVEPPAGEGRRAVSVQTASVEELAKVKGLNLKLAREIVKARPFSSLNELVKVSGIGEKTLQRLKPLLKL
jgi:DNA uptake protein ComE-like DNA-binding protein